jgi:hypothetical protein
LMGALFGRDHSANAVVFALGTRARPAKGASCQAELSSAFGSGSTLAVTKRDYSIR